ncbi:glycoside hydrolase superfamily [Aspergillus coremiiformis]|uniref:chitinase n=1 Tax=Aspergillus coremiiformis TaxID=138285 RepID=A0A5N6Z560_9EURO|nr:glycoside hydrolase superfamily [Aspergillus coremiiformis]
MLLNKLTTGLFFFLFYQNVVNALISQFTSLWHPSLASDDTTCSKSKSCRIGCCGPIDSTGTGYCGFGPDFCGSKCTSDCDRKSECDGGWGKEWANMSTCPLKVCCSKHGFCGTTVDFCGDKRVVSPECNGNSSRARTIGYYEAWNPERRSCDKMEPQAIPLGIYSHINFAFGLIDPKTFRIAPMTEAIASRYRPVTALKGRQPDLQVYIALGGWDFNEPGPTRTTFSDLAASQSAQDAFFESLTSFMLHNGFDGVDLDWEYPNADDRGGKPEDFANYVTLVKRLRERLNQSPKHFGLTLTLPASYWYLRGFDIVNLEPHVDWFNVMTYDIHGLWDADGKEIGARAYAHTNLTEINMGLELLWRNNINPERVILGLGFYGRSFTMVDPQCLTPGCPFKKGEAPAGECTNVPGVLAATEIHRVVKNGASISFDKDAAVKIATWNTNQWVSWDDVETLKLKIDYANKRCLGGTMVWAIDLDDGTLVEALGKVMDKEKEQLIRKPPNPIPCFGTPWPKNMNRTWLGT